jgi:diguanylate cyclase (GGDEF)-like protein
VGVFARVVGQWWREPVDYAAQVHYFGTRALSRAIQVLIGLGTGFNGVLSLVLLLPHAETSPSRSAVVIFGALQLFWGWAWCCHPWPSRRTSLAFIISADLGIAIMAVLDASWLSGLFGFNSFAMISVYLMFFDGPRVLLAHAAWILASTAAFAGRAAAAADTDALVFIGSTVAAVAPVVVTPLGIQLGIWALRHDAKNSVTDPLTGLLNRRGLHLHVRSLLEHLATTGGDISVMVVDLDRFKDINDRFGHRVGDTVLIRSARRIQSAVRGSAVIARTGGEEVAIVDRADVSGDAERTYDRVRSAIAAPAKHPVTASVGVITSPVSGFLEPGSDPVALLDALIEQADKAMFRAKKGGGDATVYLADSR